MMNVTTVAMPLRYFVTGAVTPDTYSLNVETRRYKPSLSRRNEDGSRGDSIPVQEFDSLFEAELYEARAWRAWKHPRSYPSKFGFWQIISAKIADKLSLKEA